MEATDSDDTSVSMLTTPSVTTTDDTRVPLRLRVRFPRSDSEMYTRHPPIASTP